MNLKLILGVALLVLLFVGVSSCSSDKDTEKPVISLIEPADGDTLQIGGASGVHLEMDLSDNEKLASYKVNIHNNFDNHGNHKAATAADSAAFIYDQVWTNIAGQRNAHVHHHEIKIPITLNGKPVREGKYHFVVYCLDEAGNESVVSRNVILSYTAPVEDHD